MITAVTKRLTQRLVTAAQAAAVLQFTGPRVTKLLQPNIDEFTLEELVRRLRRVSPEARLRQLGREFDCSTG
ncbi:XRE family transcriptional regulator [Mycobacterium sp. URHB0021]